MAPKEDAVRLVGKYSNVSRTPRIDISLPPLVSPDGNIRRKYEALGGAAALGEAISRQPGIIWTLANGSCICWNPDVGAAFEIHGAIYAKWLSLGGLNFGIPCTDEMATPDTVGRYNHFNGTTCSVYWTPATGAAAVHGAIRVRWEELGWENSYLGYPVGDEVAFAEDGRANEFQHGGIYWWSDTGPIDLRDVIVHYTGLYCFGETDSDQTFNTTDQPYAIISVTTPQSQHTARTRLYEDVDSGDSRPDVMEIYRGRPYGMNIGTVILERDLGDPDKYKEEIQRLVMKAHEAGVVALNLIPYVGPFVAAVAGPALGSLMPKLGEAISDALDLGDDTIGAANLTVPAKHMVLLAARTAMTDFWGIGYKLETGLVSGEGASYKAYFNVIPA